MKDTVKEHTQPLAYRVWSPDERSFFYSDVRPDLSSLVDRWTGFFDKEGLAIYERDILRVHHDWKLGWVRAVVVPHGKKNQYVAEGTDKDGNIFTIGFYSFAEAYRIGNLRQHPHKLIRAREQFDEDTVIYCISPDLRRWAPAVYGN